jgi:probable rRNA maturation factor
LPIHLRIENGPHRGVSRAEILRRTAAMLGALQLENAELSIVLTDDVQMQELNRAYRDKDKPTDVLAFAMREGEFARLGADLLGDVIVSIPTARRQARERGKTTLAEVTMLLAHGLLHLLGWDHDTAEKDRRMRAETDRLVAAAAGPRRPARKAPRGDRQRKQGRKI